MADMKAQAKEGGLDLDLPSLRFGRVSAASGGPVAITLNKAVAPAVEQKLRPVMRAAGRPHFTVNADPAIEEEADGPDEVDLDGADGDGAGVDGAGGGGGEGGSVAPGPAGGGAVAAAGDPGPGPLGAETGAATGAPGLPVASADGVGAAAPTGPGLSRAAAPVADLAVAPGLLVAAPPAAAPAGPPAAATVRARLTPLVQRAAAGVQAGQPGAAALRAAVGQARTALGSGDLAAAGGAADELERLLGGAGGGGAASASVPAGFGSATSALGAPVSATSAPATSVPAALPLGVAGPGRGAAPPSPVVALRDVAQGIPAAVVADPSRREAMARLLADARASADAGDAAAASAKMEALRRAIAAPGAGGGNAAGPDGTTDVDGLVTPVAEREPASGRPALAEAPRGAAPGGGALATPPPAVAAGGGLALAGGVAAAPAAPGLLGSAGSAVGRRVAAGVFTAAPEVALVVGAVVLAVWIVKHGQIRTVSVAGYDAGARGVAPISAEVNGGRGTAMLYHGLPRDTPDLQNQHSVMLRVGQDGVLTDGSGKAVARLGEGEVVPLPGVDIPGLFHGAAATLPRSEQPPADEVQDGGGGGLAGSAGQTPASVGMGIPPVSGLTGARVDPGLGVQMQRAMQERVGMPGAGQPGQGSVLMSALPPGWQGATDLPGLVPPRRVDEQLPGFTPLSDDDRRLLGRPADAPPDLDSGTGGMVGTPIPEPVRGSNVLPGRTIQPQGPTILNLGGDGSPETVDQGHQDKHVASTNNHTPGRSALTTNPQSLLDAHSGKGTPVNSTPRGQPGFRERFDTGGQVIGTYVDKANGVSSPTTRGIIHYSKRGAHIVPSSP